MKRFALGLFVVGILFLAMASGCGSSGKDDNTTDGDTDVTDGDTDLTDGDSDADSNSVTDGDSDADSNSDVIDGDSDADSSSEVVDGDSESEVVDGDSESEVTDGDSDADSDSEIVTTTGYVYVDADSFVMGTPTGELHHKSDELLHNVLLTYSFEISRNLYIQQDFNTRLGRNPSTATTCGLSCPVETVSWYEALMAANAESIAHGYTTCFDCTSDSATDTCALKAAYAKPQDCPGFRLPTEAEYEFAIRAGSITALYTSDDNDGTLTGDGSDPNVDKIAWYAGNSGLAPHAVGLLAPNAWGLKDMAGNVYEWVWDWYDVYSTTRKVVDHVTDPIGPTTGTNRGVRGGSYKDAAWTCRSGNRDHVAPTAKLAHVGFRLVRTIP